MWHVHDHHAIQHALADPSTFSSTTNRLVPEAREFSGGGLTQLDPPRHTKLRKLVNQAFTLRVVACLEPRNHEIATELLDGIDPNRPRHRVLPPLPVIVIVELLGVPSSDHEVSPAGRPDAVLLDGVLPA